MSSDDGKVLKARGRRIADVCLTIPLLLFFAFIIWICGWILLNDRCYKSIPYNIAVHLDNGFVYSLDNWHDDFRFIGDENGGVIIPRDVYGVKVEGKVIYGLRRVLSERGPDKHFSFICTYGEDCSKSQNYDEVRLGEELKKRGLPPFDRRDLMSRAGLIAWEWKKHAPVLGTLCYLYLK